MRYIEKAIKRFHEQFGLSTEKIDITEAVEKSELKNPEKNFEKFISTIIHHGDFLLDEDYIIPKASFLKNVSFRIQLHPLEIKNKILITGNRFLPFCHSSLKLDEFTLKFNKTEIPQKNMSFSKKEIYPFFSFLDSQKIPANIDDYTQKDKISYTVYDMGKIYTENSIEEGDTLIVTPKDIIKGFFSVKIEKKDQIKNKKKEIKAATDKFTEIFYDIVMNSNQFVNTEVQLLLIYYMYSKYGFKTEPEALSVIFNDSDEITYSMLDHGATLFHSKFVNHDLKDAYDRLKYEEPYEDLDTSSIDKILRWLGSSHNEIIVTALILQQLPLKKYNYNEIEEYLFSNSHIMKFYEEVKDEFKGLVKQLYEECLEEYGTTAPPLVIQSMRSKLLVYNQRITQFLRELDSYELDPSMLPSKEMSEFSSISSMIDSVLHLLEDTSQYDDLKASAELNKNIEGLESIISTITGDVRKYLENFDFENKASADYKEVFQLKIELKHIKPPIWRRILIPDNFTFADLHNAIQDSFGWYDCHLHGFEICKKGTTDILLEIGVPSEDDFHDIVDEEDVPVKQLFEKKDITINYVYDYGDYWEHKLTLEKVLPGDESEEYPRCIKGKRACPPEDCGGPYGYESMLKIIADKKHPEHKEMIEWLGGDFDPEEFDIEEIHFYNE